MKAVFAMFVASAFLTACGGAPAPVPAAPYQPVVVAPPVPVGPVAPPPKVLSPVFKEQTSRFIELGSRLVASAQYETLESFGLQVGALSAILGLMIDTGQDAMPESVRTNADTAIRFWQETVKGWELRSHRIITVPPIRQGGRPRYVSEANGAMRFSDAKTPELLGYLATAARSFEAAKRELLDLVK